MVIKRQVAGGQELLIELTAKELCDAYHEQEHNYDVEDVQNVFDNMEDEEFEERGLTRKEAESRIDEIAREKTEYQQVRYELGACSRRGTQRFLE